MDPGEQKHPATYEDLLKVPDHLVAEIIDGELYTSPRPAPRHAAASSGLGGALHGPFDRGRGGPGGWWILDEPEIHLGRDIVVPDIAGWRRGRLPHLPEEAFFSLAPDLSADRPGYTLHLEPSPHSAAAPTWVLEELRARVDAGLGDHAFDTSPRSRAPPGSALRWRCPWPPQG